MSHPALLCQGHSGAVSPAILLTLQFRPSVPCARTGITHQVCLIGLQNVDAQRDVLTPLRFLGPCFNRNQKELQVRQLQSLKALAL